MTTTGKDVEQRFRSFLAERRKAFPFRSDPVAEHAAQLHDLQVQSRVLEQQLHDNDSKLIIAQVKRRFGAQAASAVEKAAEISRQTRSAPGKAADPAVAPSASAARAPHKPLDMSGAKWEGTKVGLAAAAGGTALLILNFGIPVLAIGVGLALVGGGAGAATASTWRKHRRTAAGAAAVTSEDVQRWREHVHMLSDKVIRSEQLAAQVAQAGQTPPLAFGAEPPPLLGSPGAGGPSVSRREDSVGSGSGATAAAAGGAGPGAGPSAAGPASRLAPVPPPLAEAFRQVRHAVHTESSAWRLRAVLGSARVLEHTHGGGLAPLCAHKAVVQVDAPPRSVRNIVLELREVRRQWDLTFEHGDAVDTLSPNSDVAHIILNAAALPASSFAAERDVLVWRHWVEIPPDTTAADAETGAAGNGYLVVSVSTLHTACRPVHGLRRAHVELEAWHIMPVAFSVRSEVTHFVSLRVGGALGSAARRLRAAHDAVHCPFFERLSALALYATAKHGCLAVPLPRDGVGDAGDDDGPSPAGLESGAAVRTFQPATGLADDVFQPQPEQELRLQPVPNVGGVNGFSQPKGEMFRVRSKGYLTDRIKLPSAPSALDIAAIHAFQSHSAVRHVAAEPDSPLHAWRAAGTMPPFCLVVNMMVVGSPGFQGVFYYGMNEEEWGIAQAVRAKGSTGRPADASEAFHRLFAEFTKDDFSAAANHFRDERFKLLPAIVQGPMLLKNSSGNRPAILGNKLKQSYYRGPDYFEVDVDCTTSRAAASVVNMVKGYCKTLVIDLAFIIQGNTEDELPERVVGVVRFSRVDMDTLALRGKPVSVT